MKLKHGIVAEIGIVPFAVDARKRISRALGEKRKKRIGKGINYAIIRVTPQSRSIAARFAIAGVPIRARRNFETKRFRSVRALLRRGSIARSIAREIDAIRV